MSSFRTGHVHFLVSKIWCLGPAIDNETPLLRQFCLEFGHSRHGTRTAMAGGVNVENNLRSFVLHPGGKETRVKNLGWLLRHWQGVQSIGFNYHPSNMVDGQLIARMRDGSTYFTGYASLSVCWNWLNRPVFKGVSFKLVWNFPAADKSKDFTIGDAEWISFNCRPHQF